MSISAKSEIKIATVRLTEQGHIAVAGTLNFETIVALREAGNKLMQQPYVVVDLAEVTQVDSSALTLLLAWNRHALKQAQSIRFLNIPQQLCEIAELGGLHDILQLPAEVKL